MHRPWVEADQNDDSHCTACCHVICSDCREMCGVITNYMVFATLQIVILQIQKDLSLCFNIAGSYKSTKSYRGRDAAGSGISQGSISDMVSVVNTVPPAGDVSVSGHYQEEHGKYTAVLNFEMLLTWLEVQKLILFCSVDMDICYCVASF